MNDTFKELINFINRVDKDKEVKEIMNNFFHK